MHQLSCLIQTICPCDETHHDYFNWQNVRSQFALFLQAIYIYIYHNRRNKQNLSERQSYVWHFYLKLTEMTSCRSTYHLPVLVDILFYSVCIAPHTTLILTSNTCIFVLFTFYTADVHFVTEPCPNIFNLTIWTWSAPYLGLWTWHEHCAPPICHNIPGVLNLWLERQRLLWETHKVKDGVATQVSFVRTGWVMW